jgi:capsular exopolysaccharide synthesis family protein
MAPPIVKRFLISFEQNKWLAALAFLLSVGVSVVVAIQPPTPPPLATYRAVGRLAFQTPPPAFTSTGSLIQEQGRAVNKEMLLAPRVLQRVLEKLNLTPEQIIAIRDNRLTITFPEAQQGSTTEPQFITLEYTDPDTPTKATFVLETFMKEMVDYSRWLNTSQLRNRIEALSQRLALVQKDLTQAEEKFYRYISNQGSDLLAIQDGSLFSGITTSQQQQRSLKLTLQDLDGQINSLVKQLGLTPDQAYKSLALSADPILATLRARILDNELQLEQLQRDLRPEHPQIIKLLKDKQVNETLFQNRAKELIGTDDRLAAVIEEIRKDSNLDPARQQLANQLLVLQTQRQGLLRQLESTVKTEQQLRQQYEKSPDKQLQQARLVQAVEYQRTVYQNILSALVDAQAAEAETVGSLTVAQNPTYQPVAPPQRQKVNRLLIILAGAGIGALAGAGVILLLALVDDRLHTPQELRDALSEREVPLLGQLPLIPSTSLVEEAPPIILDVDSAYLSFYERFRSNLRRMGSESSKVILITSIAHEEGKSLTAYNLAIASAQAGKRTLLIEADLRSFSKSEWLEVQPNPDASLEPLRYYAARNEAINLVPTVENLYILPSPGPQRQAAAIIESSELKLLIADVRGRFDMVIIDTPSLSRCNDALLLEAQTDGLVLVTRPGLTRSSLLSEAIDQFEEAEVKVLGAVINGVENLVPPAMLPEILTPAASEEEEAQTSSRLEV